MANCGCVGWVPNFTVIEIYNRAVHMQGFKNLTETMGIHVSFVNAHF